MKINGWIWKLLCHKHAAQQVPNQRRQRHASFYVTIVKYWNKLSTSLVTAPSIDCRGRVVPGCTPVINTSSVLLKVLPYPPNPIPIGQFFSDNLANLQFEPKMAYFLALYSRFLSGRVRNLPCYSGHREFKVEITVPVNVDISNQNKSGL